jgi:hypothetical protein
VVGYHGKPHCEYAKRTKKIINTIQIVPFGKLTSKVNSQSVPKFKTKDSLGICHFSAIEFHSCLDKVHLINGWKLSSGSTPQTGH